MIIILGEANTKNPTGGRTEILHGIDSIINAIIREQYNTKSRIDVCGSSNFPFAISKNEALKKSRFVAKNHGVRLRYIFEITQGNIDTCKEMMKMVELRHLDGIKASFGVSETMYIWLLQISFRPFIVQSQK